MFEDAIGIYRSSPKKEEQRRIRDLAFIARLRVASRGELELLKYNYSHKNSPDWKKVAVARALAKLV